MQDLAILFTFHLSLAIFLFFAVNWIGKYSIDFGYSSTTLFEESIESIALNFFLRTLSPAVFTIIVAAICVGVGFPEFRIGIYQVAIYYYIFRAFVIVVLNRQRLVSWTRYFFHAVFGFLFSNLAYDYLILPNRSLIPNLDAAGNELWLAIFAFLYAVANKINLPEGPGAKRRNAFIRAHYNDAKKRFGRNIDEYTSDDSLKLIAYGILVYEDYARPKAFLAVERLIFWREKTTGIMQVRSKKSLSDNESVKLGLTILSNSLRTKKKKRKVYSYDATREVIASYNPDDDYVEKVMEVMQIIGLRIDDKFKPTLTTLGFE